MKNKYKKLIRNSIWTLFGNSGSKILSFLLLPLYTKWLGTYGFGLSDLITTYSSFLISIMTLSISESIFVFTKNEDNENKKTYYSSSLCISGIILFIWCIIFFLIKKITNFYSIHNSFTENIWFIYGIVITTFLQQYVQQFILSLEKIKIYSFSGLILTTCTFIFSYLLIPQLGVKGYISAIIMANIVTMLYSFIFSKSYNYFNIKYFSYTQVYPMLKYSIPLIPNSIIWWLVSALNRPIMEYYLDYSAIGIYAIANRFPHVINMIFAIFTVSWNISVFEEYNNKDFEKFYTNIFSTIFFILTGISIIFITFSKTIISIFTTPDFHRAYLYMSILIIASFLSCLSSFLATSFSVAKKSKYYFYSSIIGAITAIIFNFILIPQYGLWGAAISTFFSFFIMTLFRYKFSLLFINVKVLNKILIYLLLMIISSLCIIVIDSFIVNISISAILITVLCIQEKKVISEIAKSFIIKN